MSKRSHNHNNTKCSQRRDNLVGLKNVPRSKEQTRNDYICFKNKLENFQKYLKIYSKHVISKLGFDFNKEFCVDPNKTLGEVGLKFQKVPQKFSIPVDPDLVKRFIDAPKYILKTFDSSFKGDINMHEKTQMLCCAVMDEGVMLFEFYAHRKYPEKDPDQELHYNVGVYAILHGSQYFHIDRYDNYSEYGHRRLFDNKGRLSLEMVSKKVFENKGHTHPYNQKFAVLYTGKEHVGHEDRVVQTRYSSFATAVRAWKKKFNIQDKVLTFDDDMTFAQIEEEIRQLESKKSKTNKGVYYGNKRTGNKSTKSDNNQTNYTK